MLLVDTPPGYARLSDGTVAADYYRAMSQVELRFAAQDDAPAVPSVGELLSLVDTLRNRPLSESQRKAVQALRVGLMTFSLALRSRPGLEPLENG